MRRRIRKCPHRPRTRFGAGNVLSEATSADPFNCGCQMDQQKVLDFLKDFSSILWEAFPFIVLGALIAGILEEVVPQQAITKIIPKNKFLAVSLGGILGLVFPMCE